MMTNRFQNRHTQKIIKFGRYVVLFLVLAGFAAFDKSVKAQDSVNGGFSGVVYGVNKEPLSNAIVKFTN